MMVRECEFYKVENFFWKTVINRDTNYFIKVKLPYNYFIAIPADKNNYTAFEIHFYKF